MVSRSNSLTEHRKHYDAIDGLRTFSAIGIVLMHVLANGNYSVNGFVFERLIPSFTNFVFLFMIISGFAMCCGYYDKIVNNEITVTQFYSKRYAKIWPFFAILCILDLIISPSFDSLYEVFANLTLCFGLLPNANITVIGVGWFLGLVFVFYLMFPFFCYLISDKRRAWFSFGIALAFNLLCSEYFNIERSNILYSFVFFLAGGLIFAYREQLGKISEKYRCGVLALCVALITIYYLVSDSIVITLLMFFVCLIYSIGNQKASLLNNPVTKFLSGISMEIYLSHMVIYRVMEKIGFTHLFGDGVMSYVVTSVGTIVGTIIFATIVRWGLQKMNSMIKGRKNNG